MADYLKVSKVSMGRDAEQIEKKLETIPKLISELESSMKSLSACWDGPAWITYQNTVAGYIEKLTDIYDSMEKYVIYIKESSTEYVRAEQDVCMKINGINTWL